MKFNSKDVRVHLWSKKPKTLGDMTASTGVEIIHMPTGIEVRVDDGRSAMSSKAKAFRELKLRLKNLKPDTNQKQTMSELEAVNDAAQKIMKDFPDVAKGKLSTVLQVCHEALVENAELKAELKEVKAQYDIIKGLADDFEKELDDQESLS